MEIILNRQAVLDGKTLSQGAILDLPEPQAKKIVEAGYGSTAGPIKDPDEMKRAFLACNTTRDLFRTTLRFAGENWPAEVFNEVWNIYEQCEARLIEKGDPPVRVYLRDHQERIGLNTPPP